MQFLGLFEKNCQLCLKLLPQHRSGVKSLWGPTMIGETYVICSRAKRPSLHFIPVSVFRYWALSKQTMELYITSMANSHGAAACQGECSTQDPDKSQLTALPHFHWCLRTPTLGISIWTSLITAKVHWESVAKCSWKRFSASQQKPLSGRHVQHLWRLATKLRQCWE